MGEIPNFLIMALFAAIAIGIALNKKSNPMLRLVAVVVGLGFAYGAVFSLLSPENWAYMLLLIIAALAYLAFAVWQRRRRAERERRERERAGRH